MNAPAPWATCVVHYKENRRKCSLERLRNHPRLRFIDYRHGDTIQVPGHVLLEVGAPRLTPADAGRPLVILDATWRLTPALRQSLVGEFLTRSLPPGLCSAYPRHSKLFPDPAAGLASVEALYAALALLGHRDESLLDGYPGKELFLASCRALDRVGP